MDKRQQQLRALMIMRRRDRRRVRPSQPWWLYLSLGFIGALSLVPVLFFAATTAVAAGSAMVAYNMLEAEVRAGVEKLREVDQRETFASTRIYDRNNILLYEIVDQGRRTPIKLDDVPQFLINATVATEDDTFWENPGFDPSSVVRAVYQNVTSGRIMSGFSTITQQLVRHVAFSYEERVSQSYERKMKEVVLAWVMTQRMSKHTILEMYLNEIYYGNLAYGIEAAAKTFFGKSAKDLTPAESSFLVGLPASPLDMDPFTRNGFQRARARQKVVLGLMVKSGYITQAEADRIYEEGVNLLPAEQRQVNIQAPHFVTYVRNELEQRFGVDRVNRGGLQVVTTLDLRMQELAQDIARSHIATLKDQNVTNAALVAMRNDTGEILTMLGSIDYWNNDIDGKVNVSVRERQPGSSMKPITYAAALEQGITGADIIWDVKHKEKLTNNEIYEPKNYDEKFHGPVYLRAALANSYNIPAIKLIKRVGVQETIDTAHRMGIMGLNRGTNWYGLSLTLGGGEVTLLDMTTAYATLARMGLVVPPASILRITDSEGALVYQYEQHQPQPAIHPGAAYIVTNYLSDEQARIPAFGPNSPLKLSQPAAVKTGTTNDYRDNWTLGYTPYMTVGVWAGNSDNSQMIKSSGVTGAAPIWHDFFEEMFKRPDLLENLRPAPGQPLQQTFVRPPDVVDAPICAIGPTCTASIRELFIKGTEPKNQLAGWQQVSVVSFKSDQPERDAEGKERPGRTYYCQAVPEIGGAQTMRFLSIPKDPEEAKEVQAWLTQAGWPTPPSTPCTDEFMIMAKAGVNPSDPEAVAKAKESGAVTEPRPPSTRAGALPPPPPPDAQGGGMRLTTGIRAGINSPGNDTIVTGVTPVVGVAEFNSAEIEFFKVEFRRQGADWITIGDISRTPKSGVLEVWHAEVLAPGTYQLRLVLVKRDGNFLVPSQVTVRIER